MSATTDVSHLSLDDDLSPCPPDLRAMVTAAAADVERARGLPGELLDALRTAGCLRMAVPAQLGGRDLALADVLGVVEDLATADGSVGWAVAQVALSQIMLGYLPGPALEEIFAGGADVIAAGAAAPKGRASWTGDGWQVSGRWPLVSGAQLASWVFLQCLVVQDGSVQTSPDGMPRMVMVVLPAADVTVLATWDALGLRGTGSDDVQVRNALCPAGFSRELAAAGPHPAAVARVPPPVQGGLFVAAAVLGIARGALDEATELVAGGKRRSFSPQPLAQAPVFQDRLGEAVMTLRAARGLLFGELARGEAIAAGGRLQPTDEARLRCAGAKTVELAVAVVDTVYTLTGASAVYSGSPLQRRLRDAHTATQHFTAGRDFYGALGALLVGEPAHPAP